MEVPSELFSTTELAHLDLVRAEVGSSLCCYLEYLHVGFPDWIALLATRSLIVRVVLSSLCQAPLVYPDQVSSVS